MKLLLFVFSFLMIRVVAIAQQDPQFSQNMFLQLPVNPGYAGTNGVLCATAAYRNQWVGFLGSPKTFLFFADAPVQKLHGGLGITFINDKLGNFNFTHARGAYSYHKHIGATGKLGIGFEAGILHLKVENNWLFPSGANPPITTDNAITYDIGMGAYYRTPQLYVGMSVSHLPGEMENFSGLLFDYEVTRHYYLLAGYQFFLTSALTLLPSVHVKSDAVVTTFDINSIVHWNNRIWIGVSYRLQDAIVTMAGFAWSPNERSTLKIGYAYDIGISGLKKYHDNTHEILVSYCIRVKEKTE